MWKYLNGSGLDWLEPGGKIVICYLRNFRKCASASTRKYPGSELLSFGNYIGLERILLVETFYAWCGRIWSWLKGWAIVARINTPVSWWSLSFGYWVDWRSQNLLLGDSHFYFAYGRYLFNRDYWLVAWYGWAIVIWQSVWTVTATAPAMVDAYVWLLDEYQYVWIYLQVGGLDVNPRVCFLAASCTQEHHVEPCVFGRCFDLRALGKLKTGKPCNHATVGWCDV